MYIVINNKLLFYQIIWILLLYQKLNSPAITLKHFKRLRVMCITSKFALINRVVD